MPDFSVNTPGHKEIAFNMEGQKADYWCWAANATSIANCYNGETLWTQCRLAAELFGRQCCPPASDPKCNKESYLDTALEATRNLAAPEHEGPLSQQQIKEEIDNRRLIGVRIRWASGQAHLITIHGYSLNGSAFFVHVQDPQRPSSAPSYNELVSNYNHAEGARWSHAYFTRPRTGESSPSFSEKFAHLNLKMEGITGITKARMMKNKGHFKPIPDTKTLPHDIYTIPFAGLRDGSDPPILKTGYRLIDPSDKAAPLIFDFSDASSRATIQQVIKEATYITRYEKIIRSEQTLHTGSTPRLLRIPELSVESLWIRYEDAPAKDNVIIVNAGNSKITGSLPFQEFISRMHEAAAAIPLGTDERYR